jgi:hypothetical protein
MMAFKRECEMGVVVLRLVKQAHGIFFAWKSIQLQDATALKNSCQSLGRRGMRQNVSITYPHSIQIQN